MAEKILTNKRFFAAANGYGGFRSYFPEIFNSGSFDRIFVLKGGPGTGKSSLMKSIERELTLAGHDTEAILCSSDSESLDGVIAVKGERRVAILDGTAPHERDAVNPGAVDELVPLGELWDKRFLRAQSEKIISLAKSKANAYRTAYSYLRIAGEAHTVIGKAVNIALDKILIKKDIKHLAESMGALVSGDEKLRLISAFGKDGYITLDTLSGLSKNIISIGGKREHAMCLLSYFKAYLSATGVSFTAFPTPLSPDLTEAVFLSESAVGTVVSTDASTEIDADRYFTFTPEDSESIRVAEQLHSYALDEATRWFRIASDIHFRLEEIYTGAMCFDKMEEIRNRIIEDFFDILK